MGKWDEVGHGVELRLGRAEKRRMQDERVDDLPSRPRKGLQEICTGECPLASRDTCQQCGPLCGRQLEGRPLVKLHGRAGSEYNLSGCKQSCRVVWYGFIPLEMVDIQMKRSLKMRAD